MPRKSHHPTSHCFGSVIRVAAVAAIASVAFHSQRHRPTTLKKSQLFARQAHSFRKIAIMTTNHRRHRALDASPKRVLIIRKNAPLQIAANKTIVTCIVTIARRFVHPLTILVISIVSMRVLTSECC